MLPAAVDKTAAALPAQPLRQQFDLRSALAFFWPTPVVALTALTVLLTLLGYGADFGYLDQFQLSPEELQRTPLDFLLRSYRAVFDLLDYANDVRGKLTWALMPVWLYKIRWVLGICCAVFGSAALWFVIQRNRYAKGGAPSLSKSPEHNRLLRLRRRCSVRCERLVQGVWFVPTSTIVATVGVFAAIPYVLGALLLLFTALFLTRVAVVPTLPVSAAAARKHVIDPRSCRLLVGRSSPEVEGARCVRIVRFGCELGRGRYIDQSASRVWLLNEPPPTVPFRQTLKVFSLPTDGNVVEEVDSELSVAESQACLRQMDERRRP